MRFFLYLFLFSHSFSVIKTSNLLTNFNITIKTPGNDLSPGQIPYKSIHVKYTLPSSDDKWTIVEIKPFIRRSSIERIQQISVHICQADLNTYQQNDIWYDDETYCRGAQSMLIYQWMSPSPISGFRIADDLGFQLEKTKSIVLTVIYFKEQKIHNNPIRITFFISTLIPRFHVGTIFAGNKQRGIRFSCRYSNYPRLVYAVQPLIPQMTKMWWRIYVIRNRSFGRKSVELVLDSINYSKENKTGIEIISADIFLLTRDHILIECESISESNCIFLIYYTYKNLQYKDADENDYVCRDNDYPDLFKLLPSKLVDETDEIPSDESNIDGTTIFLLICLLLFIIWISIIIGCVIMRRIRGLVNFRSEPSSPFACQKGNPFRRGRTGYDNHRTIAEGENIAQLDVEHMGLMSG